EATRPLHVDGPDVTHAVGRDGDVGAVGAQEPEETGGAKELRRGRAVSRGPLVVVAHPSEPFGVYGHDAVLGFEVPAAGLEGFANASEERSGIRDLFGDLEVSELLCVQEAGDFIVLG